MHVLYVSALKLLQHLAFFGTRSRWGMSFFGEDRLATLVWNLFYLRAVWFLSALLLASREINSVYPKIPLPNYE